MEGFIMRKSKRIMATALATMTLVSSVGCASTETVVQDAVPTTKSVEETKESEVVESTESVTKEYSYSGYNPLDYGMEPFENPVTIKIPVFDRGNDAVAPVTDNYYIDWINENFGENMNVTVEYIPINRFDTVSEYNLLLASGDWPTVFMEYDWDKVSTWAADGALRTYDIEEFQKTAPTWFELAGGKDMFDMFKLDDGYVFAPAYRPYWNVGFTYVVFYRKDWYEKAGIPLPTNGRETTEALAKFQELGYTNGRPIIDKGAYSCNMQAQGYDSWPRSEEEWVMYSGTTVAPLTCDAVRKALEYANYEYNAGLVSPEFELENNSNVNEAETNFINGTGYSWGCYLSADLPVLNAFYENNPDGKLGILADITQGYTYAADLEGNTYLPQGRTNNPAGMFVGFSNQATDDEVKATWLYMEWMAQEDVLFFMQNGVEGETFNYDEEGNIIMVDGYKGEYLMGHGGNKDYWCIVQEVKTGSSIEDTIAKITPQGLPQDFTQEIIDLYYYGKKCADEGLAYPDPFFSVTLDSITEYSGTLEALFIEAATKLTKCAPEEFDALYEKYAQEYLDAGYQEVLDERLEAYRNGYTTKLPDVAAGRAPFVQYDIHDYVENPEKYLIQ